MMFKRALLCLILAGSPFAVAAQTVQDQIVAQLKGQGFYDISASRTLLGRVRLIALSDGLRRELVFNPATGEILRDYWEDRDDGDAHSPMLVNPNNDDRRDDRATQSGDDKEDDRDDDKNDDDSDDDNDDDSDDDNDDDNDDDGDDDKSDDDDKDDD